MIISAAKCANKTDYLIFDNLIFDNLIFDNLIFDNLNFDNPNFDNPNFDNPNFDNPNFENPFLRQADLRQPCHRTRASHAFRTGAKGARRCSRQRQPSVVVIHFDAHQRANRLSVALTRHETQVLESSDRRSRKRLRQFGFLDVDVGDHTEFIDP